MGRAPGAGRARGGGGSGNNGFRQVTKLVELQQGRKPPAKKVNYASLIAEGQKRVKALNKKLAELKKKAKGKQKDSPEIKKLTASVKRVQAEIKKNRALDAKSKGQSGPLAMGLRDNANYCSFFACFYLKHCHPLILLHFQCFIVCRPGFA